MKKLIIIAALVLCACDKPYRTHSALAAASRTSSAAELFALQSKCSQLGEKIQDNFPVGTALTSDQVSRYNPADNRCYVKLNVSSALATPTEKLVSTDTLFDGQTNEILATVSYRNQKRSAQVFDDSLRRMMKDPSSPTAEEVSDVIDKFVSPDRAPDTQKQ